MFKTAKLRAANAVIIVLGISILFHLTIVTQLIPYNIVWAGKLNSPEEMYAFEAVSLAVNILVLATMLVKRRQLRRGKDSKAMLWILWALVFLFVLNTVGNLLAETLTERVIFTPVTLLLALLIWTVARKEKPAETGAYER